jgi:hypothetical protein
MLVEALLNLTARTSGPLRRLGLVRDAVALWSRATRQRRAWHPHEMRCHEVVRHAIADLPSRRTVLVLGSGLIRDVPLEVLASTFDRVVLLDAVHLLPARLHARRLGAELAVDDLTGAATWLTGERSKRTDPLRPWREYPDLDLVISANVLSQLPMAIESWLERRPNMFSGVPHDLPDRVARWHVADLGLLACRVCLLTDTGYRVVERDGAVLEEQDLLRGMTLPHPDESWDWEVAPFGEIARDEAHIHRVHGYADFRAG